AACLPHAAEETTSKTEDECCDDPDPLAVSASRSLVQLAPQHRVEIFKMLDPCLRQEELLSSAPELRPQNVGLSEQSLDPKEKDLSIELPGQDQRPRLRPLHMGMS